MTAFVASLALCGLVAAPYLSWIFVALVGVVLVPVYVLTMLALGTPFLQAAGQGLLGYAALQVAFGLSGVGFELLRRRRKPGDHVADRGDPRVARVPTDPTSGDAAAARGDRATPMDGTPDAASPRTRLNGSGGHAVRVAGWPLFGGWLPLAAFYDPPCHADGSPWDGINDPGYRTTILVFGWLDRAVSVRVGRPKLDRSARRGRETGRAVDRMDERIRASRSRIDEPGQG